MTDEREREREREKEREREREKERERKRERERDETDLKLKAWDLRVQCPNTFQQWQSSILFTHLHFLTDDSCQ
jgi:hypothetical protein